MTGTPEPYADILARAQNAIAPRSFVWGPHVGFRSIAWVRAWVEASIDYRAPVNPATKEG